MSHADWNPGAYGLFQDLRLRPAYDLLSRIGALPDGDIYDLGCGNGAAGTALAGLFDRHRLIGVDRSPAMLAAARETGAYDALCETDIANWHAAVPAAMIFSNAVLHWLPDHAALLPRLAGMLAPGGSLAVQMPRQWGAPSHRFLRDIAVSLFPGRFEGPIHRPVKSAVHYWTILAPLGAVSVWETDYVQRLDPVEKGHPVRVFTQSTAMRPILEKLNDAETDSFLSAYDAALGAAYPLLPDGATLMPFRRVFITLTV